MVAVLAVGLIGAYSTHAAATIAPVTRVNRRTCLGIGGLRGAVDGLEGASIVKLSPFSPPRKQPVRFSDQCVLGGLERIGFPAGALHRLLHDAAILVEHVPEIHRPLHQLA